MLPELEVCLKRAESATRAVYRGRVDVVSGVLVEAEGIPAALGEVCRIEGERLGRIDAEVVGFRGSATLLMPHGDVTGIAPKQRVLALGRPFAVATSKALLGRMLDGFGQPIDGLPPLPRGELRAVRQAAPAPLEREPIVERLVTGVRAIDALNTIGKGQRLGIFAGSGVGKTTLLGQITRGTEADVIVACLVGERGREVRAFVEEVLPERARSRSVTVVATSDRAPIERFLAPFVAVTVAESFRDAGCDVLLVVDSVTRFAAAAREIGLAAGEPPTIRGYPPSFFATVPKLVERMGRTAQGSITGLLTILLEGDDAHDPVADTMRGLLDGHLGLTRELAQAGRYPAIDVLTSLSRLMPALVDEDHLAAAASVRDSLAAVEDGRDLIDIGAYQSGANPRLDLALARMPAIEMLLRQAPHETTPWEETRELLAMVAGSGGGA